MSETLPSSQLPQSIGAIFAGILIVVLFSTFTDTIMHASGIFPQSGQPMSSALFLLAAVYRIIYIIVGGYLTARLAPHHPIWHALILGLIGFAFSLMGTVATWNRGPEFGPKWYPISLVVLAIPCSLAGALLRERLLPTNTNN